MKQKKNTTENSLEACSRFAFCVVARAPFSALESRAKVFVAATLVRDEAAERKEKHFQYQTEINFAEFPMIHGRVLSFKFYILYAINWTTPSNR